MEKTGIAFIATGDELACGYVVNTVTPWMANLLYEQGYHCKEHRVTSDIESDIAEAISDAAKRFRVVILCGGLGPTVDDRTRYALADACKTKLVFHDNIWVSIQARLEKLGLTVPENNRSQAMLPANAVVIDNHNGTAAGCLYDYEGSTVCMLPGPPNESQPMFLDTVLPFITSILSPVWPLRERFLLFGTSEGHIATLCEPLITSADLDLGFRVDYPYLELKLFGKANAAEIFEKAKSALLAIIGPHWIGTEPLSAQLYTQLLARNQAFCLDDRATGGHLLSQLLTPDTSPLINTAQSSTSDAYTITITGLNDYWQKKATKEYSITFSLKKNNKIINDITKKIPARGRRSLRYACEWVCLQWLEVESKN